MPAVVDQMAGVAVFKPLGTSFFVGLTEVQEENIRTLFFTIFKDTKFG